MISRSLIEYGYHALPISQYFSKQEYIDLATKQDFDFYMSTKTKNKTELHFKGVVKGTVKSGHPLDTTLYNSVRCRLYYKLITRGHADRCRALIAGDDLVILCKRDVAAAVYA